MKTVKKVGFQLLTNVFNNRPQCEDGANITNTVKVHGTAFPWFNNTVPGFGTSYCDEKGQEWQLRDYYYIWSTMGGLSKLASKGSTLWVKYAICHAVSACFTRTEDYFHFSMPTHIIHVAYAERLRKGGGVTERKYVTDIYWVTPEQRDCLREIYTHQRLEWENA